MDDVVACAGCAGTVATDPPRLVAANGSWHVACPGCGLRSPSFLDRSFATRSWNRGDRKKDRQHV